MGFHAFDLARFRNVIKDPNRSSAELYRFVVHYLVLFYCLSKSPGLGRLFEGLRYGLSFERLSWAHAEWEQAGRLRKQEEKRLEELAQRAAAQLLEEAQREEAERVADSVGVVVRDFLGKLKQIPLAGVLEMPTIPKHQVELSELSFGSQISDLPQDIAGRASNLSDGTVTSITLAFQVFDYDGDLVHHPACGNYDPRQSSDFWGCDEPLITRDSCDKLAEETVVVLLEIPPGQARDFEQRIKSRFRKKHFSRSHADTIDVVKVTGISKQEATLRSAALVPICTTKFGVRLQALRSLIERKLCTIDQVQKLAWSHSRSTPWRASTILTGAVPGST